VTNARRYEPRDRVPKAGPRTPSAVIIPRVSVAEHRRTSPAEISCFVLTISDTRTEDNDTSGDAITGALREAGHLVTGRRIVRDEPAIVRDLVLQQAGAVDIVITTGGTGITSRDSTYEAISSVLEKRIDGFGELFRMLSFPEIGAAAMMSRACAGTIGRTAVFSLPGSENAVRLAMRELILPELGHVVRELSR
jgi:molybdopterin adenylyltransferase